MASVCTLCDKRMASRAKVYGHFRHYHHMHFDQCVQMLQADGFVLDPTVSTMYPVLGQLANLEIQRFTKRLVRGCENFLPALA